MSARVILTPWARNSVTDAEFGDLTALPLPPGSALNIGSKRRPRPFHARVFRDREVIGEAWHDDALEAGRRAAEKARAAA
jgi:hypothetical protein